MAVKTYPCLCVCAAQRLHGEDLPLQQSGFVSVTELVDAMSDTFDLKAAETDAGQHWIVNLIQDRDVPHTGMRIG